MLLAAYDDPTRGYHDRVHLTEVLDRIDEISVAGVSGDGPAVRLAAWFHDGVYDGERGDEDRSAVWAEEALADTDHGVEVARLVRLTEHHDPADDDLPGQVLCDADLAILAASPARYDAYLAGVRTAVLRDLVGRARLFHTAYAREHWEPTARANLTRELTASEPQL